MKLRLSPRLGGVKDSGKSDIQKFQFGSTWKMFANNQPFTFLSIKLALKAEFECYFIVMFLVFWKGDPHA